MNYTVYKHTSPSGKVYVGITSMTVERRWGNNGNAYKNQGVIWKAVCKYGWENINHEIIKSGLSEKEAKDLEISTIAKFKSNDSKYGYNCTIGGDGTCGWKYNSNQRELLMRRLKGNKYALGCVRSEKTKKKQSEARKDKHSVSQIGLNGKLITTFKSVADASKSVNGNRANIAACCNGRQLTAYGYQWRYVGEEHTTEEVLKGGKWQPTQIVQLTKEGQEIARFDSIKAAAKHFGCGNGRSGISACLYGKAHTAYGFRWMLVPTAEAGANKLLLSGTHFRFEAVV